ncbi:hypothetical protein T440DRAFT_485148 [Plenodomus tracheiphilus IPT5]|uniref:Mre11 DNA-binding domain-containing protein n=1 Tax=Plenodomus tracheiphilus IPT5 TaxID=1408161 RepID=A0A6A7BKE8_9PLEO|nr:hypothetical protein T440DRAFT_485148 [Plenodomus tracheiphilus IPT5]
MPPRARGLQRGADTIRILIATDSHVGYNERDAERKDDSWKTFHEVMCLAKEHDVDMVLHAGDLFHENKPSRKSMYQVMRSLRMNCLGEKPCELEMLSDASENFGGIFDHVNYEDEDINIAIPVFAIHGNHDDPSGEGSYSPLDLLQASGFVNYFGRTPEVDKIAVKPVLLQKGGTKLALYGLSNVRDERLFHTWRDGNVKFFQPGTQKDEWFNLMSVHQNHHAHTPTSYLPENFLPDFIDLVVWGHEHECLIDPRYNPEMGFHVMQPGSSVATSLMPGEAVPKHIAILSVTGKEFTSESIRLKTVRPFIMKEIVLAEEKEIQEKEIWRITDNRAKITQYLNQVIEGLIEDARRDWLELQVDRKEGDELEVPLPLVRLRVEYTAPQPGEFHCENPQRISNRFMDKVANVNDVVQFHRKKKIVNRALKNNAEMPDEQVLAELSIDSVKVDKLVKEFLTAQTLTILPQNSFGDAVTQFVDKDDKHAMETFVKDSLTSQLNHLMNANEVDEEEIINEMDQYRSQLETLFASGQLKKTRKTKLKPKPDGWDSEFDGSWAEQPAALVRSDNEGGKDDDENPADIPPKKAASRGRGKAAGTTRQAATAPKKAPATAKAGRGRQKLVEEEEDDEDDDGDVVMISDDDEESAEDLFVRSNRKVAPAKKAAAKAPTRAKSPVKKTTTSRVKAPAASKQSTLNFSQTPAPRSQPTRPAASRGRKVVEPSRLGFQVDHPIPRFCPFTSMTCYLPFDVLRGVPGFARTVARLLLTVHFPSISFEVPTLVHGDGWLPTLPGGELPTMSLAYKVEELLALRDSVSESAVSIDKFADEDVIKEHVLRPSASASANLACRASNRSLRPQAAVGSAQAAPVKKPSPSPSFKRGKAEKLLKEHGSPPGLRVTAGGRIVPSDLPPLGTSQYGDTTYHSHFLRAASGNVMPTNQHSNGNSTARIEVIGGQPVLFVGDRMFALPAVNATNPTTTLSIVTPTMETSTKAMPDLDHLNAHSTPPGAAFGPSRASSQSPFAGLDLTTLKAQQAIKKQELRTVEQTEVLQASQQTEAWRTSMIEKKRCLIVELDALRKQITSLEDNCATAQPGPDSTTAPFAPQFAQSLPQSLYGFPSANPYAPMMMYQPPSFGSFPPFPAAEPTPFVPVATPNPPHSPGSASRRSHAIEIKPPREEPGKQLASALDPKSPTYEPALKSNVINNTVPPTPSPPKNSAWGLGEVSEGPQQSGRDPSQKLSLSSIDTTDFFPTNTHEYSLTRVAPRVIATSNGDISAPSTPEKHWPASPWNEDNSGRSRKENSAPKLTSWPEAFGRQSSLSTLRNSTGSHTVAASQERASIPAAMMTSSTSGQNVLSRTKSEQRTGTEENWAFSTKAVSHVPSTYQEGYQAGYDHVGVPDSPDVLQGFIQGLMHFLSDEAKKRQFELSARNIYVQGMDSRTPSLRGLVAGSTPHDSGISMTFNRSNVPSNGQENARSATEKVATDVRLDPGHNPHGRDDLNQDTRPRVASAAMYPSPAGLFPFPERKIAGQYQSAFAMAENSRSKASPEMCVPSRSHSASTAGVVQQIFGHQLQNREYMTPLTQQRFYPTPKEKSPSSFTGTFTGDKAPSMRHLADHRFSGLDGAMDDLAELSPDIHDAKGRGSVDVRSNGDSGPAEVEEEDASCFKPSGGKGKQKATYPPAKATTIGADSASSPVVAPSSPRKSGEQSPAKAKLEQVTNKFRRVKKDDARVMSPEDKKGRSDKWRVRFQQLKKAEIEEIEEHRKTTRT